MELKRKIKICWSCTDWAHHEYRWYWTAWICGKFQRLVTFFRRS